MATETKKTETKAMTVPPPNGNGDKALVKTENAIAMRGDAKDWQTIETGEDRFYAHLSIGNAIKGRAVGLDTFEDDDGSERKFIKVQLFEPCMVVVKKQEGEKEATPFEAPIGSMVWVGVRQRLIKTYETVRRSPTLLNLWIEPTRQVKIPKRPQPMWDFLVRLQVTKIPQVVSVAVSEDTEETPF